MARWTAAHDWETSACASSPSRPWRRRPSTEVSRNVAERSKAITAVAAVPSRCIASGSAPASGDSRSRRSSTTAPRRTGSANESTASSDGSSSATGIRSAAATTRSRVVLARVSPPAAERCRLKCLECARRLVRAGHLVGDLGEGGDALGARPADLVDGLEHEHQARPIVGVELQSTRLRGYAQCTLEAAELELHLRCADEQAAPASRRLAEERCPFDRGRRDGDRSAAERSLCGGFELRRNRVVRAASRGGLVPDAPVGVRPRVPGRGQRAQLAEPSTSRSLRPPRARAGAGSESSPPRARRDRPPPQAPASPATLDASVSNAAASRCSASPPPSSSAATRSKRRVASGSAGSRSENARSSRSVTGRRRESRMSRRTRALRSPATAR